MANYLVLDYGRREGFREIVGPLPDRIDVGGGEFDKAMWVPWAITHDERVVYAQLAESYKDARMKGLRAYDGTVSQQRRSLCHTALGLIALNRPQFSRQAVDLVSRGVHRFLCMVGDKKIYAEGVGKYLYGTTRYRSFGRISDTDRDPAKEVHREQMWGDAMRILTTGLPLSTVLNIHDGVGRIFYVDKPGGERPGRDLYMYWYNKLRADKAGEMFHTTRDRAMPWRGRKNKTVKPGPSSMPGNIKGTLPPGFEALQDRIRGVELYDRIEPAPVPTGENGEITFEGDQNTSGNYYFWDLDELNELFGAGPSGTTGTLLSAAFAFGGFKPATSLELTRQYLFAIVGYLVGGGMHTLNESLAIIRLVGLEYHTGSLRGHEATTTGTRSRVTQKYPLLPSKFLTSPEFTAWSEEYYDIVALGGTHWRFRQVRGSMPPTLKKKT